MDVLVGVGVRGAGVLVGVLVEVGVTGVAVGVLVAVAVAYWAVYVVGLAGATMLWVCGPASDQDENRYVVPPKVWGEGALIEFVEPTITVRVNGAVAVLPPTVS